MNAARKVSPVDAQPVVAQPVAKSKRSMRVADDTNASQPSPALQLRDMLVAEYETPMVDERWPGAVRMMVIVGGCVASWAAVIAAGMAIFH